MVKPMELLVIEDTPEFQKVAKIAFANVSMHVTYVETYEKALQALTKGTSAVITDLFFPGKISAKGKYIQFGQQLGVLPIRMEDINWWDENAKICAKSFPIQLSEEPSGILVAEYCLEHNIPYVILSHGNRHEGNLAMVRYYMQYLTLEVSKIKDKKKFSSLDPGALRLLLWLIKEKWEFYYLLFNKDGVDKKNPEVWSKALEYVNTLK